MTINQPVRTRVNRNYGTLNSGCIVHQGEQSKLDRVFFTLIGDVLCIENLGDVPVYRVRTIIKQDGTIISSGMINKINPKESFSILKFETVFGRDSIYECCVRFIETNIEDCVSFLIRDERYK